VTRNKVKEMYYFAKLLNCKSYGDILELKKNIDSDMYKIITDMYERLYQDYDYDVIVEEKTIDTSAEHVKELEDELLKLRIENAFLKELRRLRLEDEAKMRERRSSSTASEENSD
jgi:hypothetical protein